MKGGDDGNFRRGSPEVRYSLAELVAAIDRWLANEKRGRS